jgi:Ca2+-binding EF-hand superfamily protein
MRVLRTLALTVLAAGVSLPAYGQKADSLSRAQLAAGLEARFKLLDGNGNGSFDKAEYMAARRKAEQAASAEIRALLTKEFGELDANRDGAVIAAEIDAKVKAGAGKQTLTRLDRNKDQKISLAEYAGQAGNVSATNNADQQLKTWDSDGNGQITLAEYRGTALSRFDSLDGNKDGTLTAAEEAAARAKQPVGR